MWLKPINKALTAEMKLRVSINNALEVKSCIVKTIPAKPVPMAKASTKVLLNSILHSAL
jgi:hypothetical protein